LICRRHGFKTPKGKSNDLIDAVSSDDNGDMDDKIEAMLEDEIDKYNSMYDQDLAKKGEKGAKGSKKDVLEDSDDEQVSPVWSVGKNFNQKLGIYKNNLFLP